MFYDLSGMKMQNDLFFYFLFSFLLFFLKHTSITDQVGFA